MGLDMLYPRAPSIQIVPTLGSKVYKYYLLWAFWSPRGKSDQLAAMVNAEEAEEQAGSVGT